MHNLLFPFLTQFYPLSSLSSVLALDLIPTHSLSDLLLLILLLALILISIHSLSVLILSSASHSLPLGTSWGLDGGYTGSSSTVLYSIAMYTSQIGVVGTGRNSDQTQTTFVRNPGNSKHCLSVPYIICSRLSVYCALYLCILLSVSVFVIICDCL